MLVGAHESIAGDISKAFDRAVEDKCEALAIFTSHNTRWADRPLKEDELTRFKKEHARLKIPVLSHAIYLLNLASSDEDLFKKSVKGLREEIERCERLGVNFIVFHPGSHTGSGLETGIKQIRKGLHQVLMDTPGYKTQILLENVAGQGTNIGRTFDELKQILEGVAKVERLGICFDTCHAFAAGYDLVSDEGYEATFAEFDKELGISRLKAFHLNDSQGGFGSKKDRHTHIGEGTLGEEPFKRLINDKRFSKIPGVVETPPDEEGGNSFAKNVARLKGYRGSF